MPASDVQFVHAGGLRPDDGWHLSRHMHPFSELVVILRGTHIASIRRMKLVSHPGDVLFYPAGVSHEEWAESDSPFELAFVAFKGGDIPPEAGLRVADTRSRMRHLVSWLVDERGSYHTGAEELRNRFTAALVAEFARSASGVEHGIIERVREYVGENLNRPIDLQGLADMCGLSKFHFIRTFRERAGRTPMADVRALRLEAARDLLLTTNMPLKQIAPRVGFQSEYHLSRVFRAHFGLSARQLRTRVASDA